MCSLSLRFESVVDGKVRALASRKYLNEGDKPRYARRKGNEWLWLTTLAPDNDCRNPWITEEVAKQRHGDG